MEREKQEKATFAGGKSRFSFRLESGLLANGRDFLFLHDARDDEHDDENDDGGEDHDHDFDHVVISVRVGNVAVGKAANAQKGDANESREFSFPLPSSHSPKGKRAKQTHRDVFSFSSKNAYTSPFFFDGRKKPARRPVRERRLIPPRASSRCGGQP